MYILINLIVTNSLKTAFINPNYFQSMIRFIEYRMSTNNNVRLICSTVANTSFLKSNQSFFIISKELPIFNL